MENKTLIIHPKDPSTSFLDIVYNSIENKTVITGGVTKSVLKEMILEHDRIIMMGHGSPYGLFSIGQFKTYEPYIIDNTFVTLLKKKKDNVFIWCNADVFVKYYKLDGFFSGMFVSEVGEGLYCGLHGTTQDIVDESNFGFCKILAKHINEVGTEIHKNVIQEYGLIAEHNPVALYNNNRLYYS